MKRAGFLYALAVLGVASLLAGCDSNLPTQPGLPLADEAQPRQNQSMPPDCAAGIPSQYAHGCIPLAPVPPTEGPSG